MQLGKLKDKMGDININYVTPHFKNQPSDLFNCRLINSSSIKIDMQVLCKEQLVRMYEKLTNNNRLFCP